MKNPVKPHFRVFKKVKYRKQYKTKSKRRTPLRTKSFLNRCILSPENLIQR
ncbi:hypothetical protein LEP1GSC074_1498 [Leptospira noguchii str. Hook]|nr:hypothetical protein LEP1GSC074_1498 [Leptospira noguchii str. Hook]